jgi:hypothetical protein
VRYAIEAQIKSLDEGPALTDAEVETLIDRIIDQLQQADDLVRRAGRPAIERMLDVLLARAVADIESKTVDFEFRLPQWALAAPEALCLESGHGYTTWRETGAGSTETIEDGLLLMRLKALPLSWFVFGRVA